MFLSLSFFVALAIILLNFKVFSDIFKDGMKRLNLLLSFAVGSLLGDVFLHLLPESWQSGGIHHTYFADLIKKNQPKESGRLQPRFRKKKFEKS